MKPFDVRNAKRREHKAKLQKSMERTKAYSKFVKDTKKLLEESTEISQVIKDLILEMARYNRHRQLCQPEFYTQRGVYGLGSSILTPDNIFIVSSTTPITKYHEAQLLLLGFGKSMFVNSNLVEYSLRLR